MKFRCKSLAISGQHLSLVEFLLLNGSLACMSSYPQQKQMLFDTRFKLW